MGRENQMIDYFEKRANSYRSKSARGLWSRFRKSEFSAISRLLSPRREERLLDLGCGAGQYALSLREKFSLTVLAIDSSPAMLGQLKAQGIETWLGCAEDFSPQGRRFDYVLAAGLLEFVERAEDVIKISAAALEPGGKLVLLIPAGGLRGRIYKAVHEWQGCPVFFREAEAYIGMAKAHGFTLLTREACTPISTALAFRRGR